MTSAIDKRKIRLGIEINGQQEYFEDLAIEATGSIYTNGVPADCTARLYNLTADQRNYILTKASPLLVANQNRQPILMTLEIGRESTGLWKVFGGSVLACNVTQPPDIGITLKSIADNYLMNVVSGATSIKIDSLRSICQRFAESVGKRLVFQATDKMVENWNYSQSAMAPMQKLNQIGGILAYIDGDELVVLNENTPRDAASIPEINAETGMIGIPQVTEYGVLLKCFPRNDIVMGSKISVKSKLNPAVDGEYWIRQLTFSVANRAQPFYYNIMATVSQYYQS